MNENSKLKTQNSKLTLYLDHAATAPVRPEAVAAAVRAMELDYGNPSSGHELGRRAREIVEDARAAVASALGCDSEEIVFTSGGTEADGMAFAPHSRGELVVTALEHPAVSEAAALAKSRGCGLTVVNPGTDGHVTPEAFAAAVTPDTALISCMLVCHETGAIQPVQAIAAAAKRENPAVRVHSDLVQAFLKLPVNVRDLGVDTAALSGHKLGAPKGVGALYVRAGFRLRPLLRGGGQERGLRPGTEAVPLIAAFGAAVRAGLADFAARTARLEALKQYALNTLDCVFLPGHDAPHILGVALPGCPGQVAQRLLSEQGIMVSTGSACSRGKKSAALIAMKQPNDVVESALRLSFGAGNTTDELDRLDAALRDIRRRFGR